MREEAPRLRVEVARNAAQAEAHLVGWRQLEAAALDDNFYYSPEFLLPALRWLMPDEDVRIAFVYEGGAADRLVGCAPFTLLPGVDGLPLPALANVLSRHGYLGTPLLHRECAAEVVVALADWLDAPERPWQLVSWGRVPVQSRTWNLIESEMTARGRPPLLRYSFDRPIMTPAESFDAYLAWLSRRRRKNYRRQHARLAEMGELEVIVHRDLSQRADLAAAFMALEGQGWKLEQGGALIGNDADRGFFAELVQRSGEAARLLFVELRLDGRPVAMQAQFVAGTTLFAFKVGYDHALAELSPGTVSEVECARAFIESGLCRADSGTSGPTWAAPYWTDVTPIGELVVATPGLTARAALGIFPVVRGLKRAAVRPATWAADWLRRSEPAA